MDGRRRPAQPDPRAVGLRQEHILHLIAGLLRPSRGRVLVAGQDLAALTPAELDAFRGRMIGIVLQRLHLIPALTVRDNLRLARTLARLPPDAARIDSPDRGPRPRRSASAPEPAQ